MKITTTIIMALLMFCSLSVMAEDTDSNAFFGQGVLYLFQKCDRDFIGDPDYDDVGCPLTKEPWPVLFHNHRWGRLQYNLFGHKFNVSFEGYNLLPRKKYTLAYIPAPWPGVGLICLGRGKTDAYGHMRIYKINHMEHGLPMPGDDNFENGLGAKIRLIASEDIRCESPSTIRMTKWNPEEYLFEYNPIVFEYLKRE